MPEDRLNARSVTWPCSHGALYESGTLGARIIQWLDGETPGVSDIFHKRPWRLEWRPARTKAIRDAAECEDINRGRVAIGSVIELLWCDIAVGTDPVCAKCRAVKILGEPKVGNLDMPNWTGPGDEDVLQDASKRKFFREPSTGLKRTSGLRSR